MGELIQWLNTPLSHEANLIAFWSVALVAFVLIWCFGTKE
jgi:hypothetical protein